MPDNNHLELVAALSESVTAYKQLISHITTNTGELGRLDERLLFLETQCTRIIKLMYEGTPHQPGLVQELAALSVRVTVTETEGAKHSDSTRTHFYLVLCGFITSIVAALIAAWYHLPPAVVPGVH